MRPEPTSIGWSKVTRVFCKKISQKLPIDPKNDVFAPPSPKRLHLAHTQKVAGPALKLTGCILAYPALGLKNNALFQSFLEKTPFVAPGH
jgi:hypothetical protein